MKRRFWVVASTILFSCFTAATALAGEWRQDEVGWRYLDDNGEFLADRWLTYNRARYHFDENGYMNTGWYFDPLDFALEKEEDIPNLMKDTHGYGGYYYYFEPEGKLVQYDYTPDGYWVDVSGAWDFCQADLSAAKRYQEEQEAKRIYLKEKEQERLNQAWKGETREDGICEEYVEELFDLINEERDKINRNQLIMSDMLNRAAEIRAEEMAESFEHKRTDGRAFSTVLDDEGISYEFAAENGAQIFSSSTAVSALGAWMRSPLHKAIMLSNNYSVTGLGCYCKDDVYYWCQLFITTE